ncbi:Cys-tRNA(Pro) deacylase [Acinetobacter boissieri]|uniref:Cys-tRNA(Pro)/Cys-tRNA(Cys) deacylase n=1 Tax=Acinetobacter boissieri TaxID=1219383 RepID=A0A1G6JIT9_9GAMM|nr:Cys-tRNA(Pro) deacylase [Acinetobacter boissieri]SDC17846.1 Cys-tRNA(Pro)/Cys-tRNA(Cys) deacylase [Acinetobacter boissieri]
MTPACKLLKQKNIAYTLHEYIHDANSTNSYGLEAVEKLALPAHEVFKTLLVSDGKNYYVAILPVSHQLNLKKIAAALGCKKLVLAEAKDAERLTGFVVGGISPLGQKKHLKTIIDLTAQSLEKVYVSGGRRGLDIGLSPNDLSVLLAARFIDIIDEKKV